MAVLRLFGWALQLRGNQVLPPTGESIWDPQEFRIRPNNRIGFRGAINLAGVPFHLDLTRIALTRDANGDYRPTPNRTYQGNVFSSVQGSTVWQLGPVRLTRNASRRVRFSDDHVGIPLLETEEDWLRPGVVVGSTPPVSVGIRNTGGDTQYIQLNFAERRFIIPEGGLIATLNSANRLHPEAGREVRYRNARREQITFAQMAQGGENNRLDLHFTPLAGADDPVWLNTLEAVSSDTTTAESSRLGLPAIEALEADLQLQLSDFRRSRNPRLAEPNSRLTGASLRANNSKRIRLRFPAARNSRNQAEEWHSELARRNSVPRVPLGFRTQGNFPSPVVQPNHSISLSRVRPKSRLGEAEDLPIHGWFGNSHVQLEPGAPMVLVCPDEGATPSVAQPTAEIPAAMLWRQTRPVMRFTSSKLHHGRPGEAYLGNPDTARWVFSASNGRTWLPALPRRHWESGDGALADANRLLNTIYSDLVLEPEPAEHETGLSDRSSARPSIRALVPDGSLRQGAIELSSHVRLLAMASPTLQDGGEDLDLFNIEFDVPDNRAVEYAIYWPEGIGGLSPQPPSIKADQFWDWGNQLGRLIDPVAPLRLPQILPREHWPSEFPKALVKLTRDKDLSTILRELVPGDGDTPAIKLRSDALAAIRRANPDMLKTSWVGVVVFFAPIDFTGFPAVKALVPTDLASAPRFDFLALAPRSPNGAEDVALSAGIRWENSVLPPLEPSGDKESEAFLTPRHLFVDFRDNRLVLFDSKATFTLFSILGQSGPETTDRKDIDILGSIRQADSDAGVEIRFAAKVPAGGSLQVYPITEPIEKQDEFFVESVFFRRLEVIDRPQENGERAAEIQIDGSMKFNKELAGFEGYSGFDDFFQSFEAVSFSSLRIDLSAFDGLLPRELKLKYPSLNFNIDLPHVSLLGNALRLKFRQLALDWEGAAPTINLDDYFSITGGDGLNVDLTRVLFIGRLDFGDLPAIFARKVSGFSLDGCFGFNIDNGKLIGNPFIGVSGFGFAGLNLDLASFITLRIKELRLGRRTWPAEGGRPALSGAEVVLNQGSLDILRYPVLKKLSGAYFSVEEGRSTGFWALLGEPASFPLLEFDWVFLANNVDFSADVVKTLIVPPPMPPSDPGMDPGDDNDEDDTTHGKLVQYWDNGVLRPRVDGQVGWTFGASLNALEGFLEGRALFQDGGFMGLSLDGRALEQLFGYPFMFVGIYRKDITPGEDYFYFSITLPPFSMGTVAFMGGQIAAELFTSGDFMADFGFPWQSPKGGRAWGRTIGAIITPGQASGGFYLRKRERTVVTGKELTVAAGFAIQWGLGANFSAGPFRAWVRIGVYAAMEGEFVILIDRDDDIKIIAIYVQGAAGVLAEGAGVLDWWIIYARVSVRASAEIRTSIRWTAATNVTLMRIEAELHCSASARACIGPKWARVCKRIRARLNMPVRHNLKFS